MISVAACWPGGSAVWRDFQPVLWIKLVAPGDPLHPFHRAAPEVFLGVAIVAEHESALVGGEGDPAVG